tara:strand:- start:127 stop:1533 length:1407 start_codon:yes stop_codon:yes gene_type:complete
MAYYPKSQIKIQSISKVGIFKYKITELDFTGKYIETSEGLYYEGADPMNLGQELVRVSPSSEYLNNNDDINSYHKLNKITFNFMKKRIPFLQSRPKPTKIDYERGYFPRYFVKKVNEKNDLREINKEIYTDISERKGVYDYNLYKAGAINWSLEDTAEPGSQKRTNRLNLQLLEKDYPNVSTLFFPLDEYKKSLNFNYTFGKELYYENGKEYTGFYHIHPKKGPMVGQEHKDEPHAQLYWANYLSSVPVERTPGEYWKYKQGTGPYGGYGPNHMTVYFTNKQNQTVTFSSELEYFVHRDTNGYPEDWSEVKEYDKGVYWMDIQDPTGTVYYSANPSGIGGAYEVAFSSPDEFYDHRERHGFPRDFSNITKRDPNKADRLILGAIGDEIAEQIGKVIYDTTGQTFEEATEAAKLQGLTLEEYMRELLGTSDTTTTTTSTTTSGTTSPTGGTGGGTSGGGGSSGGGGGGY